MKLTGNIYLKDLENLPDEIIDVDGSVMLYNNDLKKFPVIFGHVTGDFDCSHNKLASLEGAPKTVGGFFDCGFNQLISLEGCPILIGKNFNCNYNTKLISFKGYPKSIGKNFYCSGINWVNNGLLVLNADGPRSIVCSDGEFEKIATILNKYLGQGNKGILLAKIELEKAGLGQYAKL